MPVASKNEDLEFGLRSEEKNKASLESFFGMGLKKTGKFDPMDYTNETQTIFIEMKTRRIKHNQYPTALIGKNKVDFCKSSDATCYFVYVYLDGMFYVKYDQELFATFECADFERGWREGGIQPKQLFYYIPHEHLAPLI
jgi:hypothetical protein